MPRNICGMVKVIKQYIFRLILDQIFLFSLGDRVILPDFFIDHIYNIVCGSVAQLVEQWTENPCVAGSIPARATDIVTQVIHHLIH